MYKMEINVSMPDNIRLERSYNYYRPTMGNRGKRWGLIGTGYYMMLE